MNIPSQDEIKDLVMEFYCNFCEDNTINKYYLLRSINRWLAILQDISNIAIPQGRVLDIGLGHGCLSSVASQMGFDVYAVDAFPGVRLEVLAKYHIKFHECVIEAQKLPFQDEFFNVVILANVLEHFNYSPLVPLKEINRVLTINGSLFLTTPNIACLDSMIALLLGGSIDDSLKIWINEEWGCKCINNRSYRTGHHRIYTMAEVKKVLQLAGFTICKTRFLCRGTLSPHNILKDLFRRLLSCIQKFANFRFFGDTIYVIAKKKG